MSRKSASPSFGRLFKSAFQTALGSTSCGVAIISIAALAGGCDSSTSTSDIAIPNEATDRQADPLTTPSAMPEEAGLNRSPLVGAWMGKAIINEQALLTTADALPGDQRQALIHEARTFVTTEMAIQFSPSGEIETAIEVQSVGGQKIAGQTFGTWKVVEATNNGVTVETTGTDETGSTVTNRTTFAVSVDGDRLVLQPQVSSALAGCEALIFLDRQMTSPTASVAQMPEANQAR